MLKKTLALILTFALWGCDGAPPTPSSGQPAPPDAPTLNLSPEHWPAGVLDAYHKQMLDNTNPAEALARTAHGFEVSGSQGIVATTSNPLAVHAGIETLRKGGSAVDAAITVALAQVVLHGGGATSFAGQMGLFYYDASKNTVESLNGSYATVLNEDDPLTIPPYGNPSGRAVLTPGFMAGFEAAHERFGSIPWNNLFEPAIHFAAEGFPVSNTFRGLMESRKQVITRHATGRAIFLNQDGQLPSAGSTFKQPQVAAFLRKVARQGANYLYHGAWAEKFVAAVQAEGGKLSLQDMAQYKPDWVVPLKADINGYEVYGGGGILEVLRIAELAGLQNHAHYSQDPDRLYEMIKISRIGQVLGPNIAGDTLAPAIIEAAIPTIDLDPAVRYTAAGAKAIYAATSTPAWADVEKQAEAVAIEQAATVAKLIAGFGERKTDEETPPPIDEDARPDHTAGIIVVDKEGNMAAVAHSVTSAIWGEIGLFVEGVSVVDPGAFSQFNIDRSGPGKKMLDYRESPGCPAIAVRDGVAVAGCGVVGASYDTFAHQGMVNLVLYGQPHPDAAVQPMFRKNWPPGVPLRQPLGEGEFPPATLAAVKAHGIDIEAVEDPSRATSGSVFVGAGTNPETGKLEGGVTSGTHAKMILDSTGLIQAY